MCGGIGGTCSPTAAIICSLPVPETWWWCPCIQDAEASIILYSPCRLPGLSSDSRAEADLTTSSNGRLLGFHHRGVSVTVLPVYPCCFPPPCIIHELDLYIITSPNAPGRRNALPPDTPGLPAHRCERTDRLPRMSSTTELQFHNTFRKWTKSFYHAQWLHARC